MALNDGQLWRLMVRCDVSTVVSWLSPCSWVPLLGTGGQTWSTAWLGSGLDGHSVVLEILLCQLCYGKEHVRRASWQSRFRVDRFASGQPISYLEVAFILLGFWVFWPISCMGRLALFFPVWFSVLFIIYSSLLLIYYNIPVFIAFRTSHCQDWWVKHRSSVGWWWLPRFGLSSSCFHAGFNIPWQPWSGDKPALSKFLNSAGQVFIQVWMLFNVVQARPSKN